MRLTAQRGCLLALAALAPALAWAAPAHAGAALPWWAWPVLLFVVSFLIGIIAVAAGIGGGVLFVPIVGSLFPFHLDFVRGAGLMLALCGALSSGPRLLRAGLADLRMVIPLSLAGSVAAMAGAHMGLLLPTRVLQISLGIIVLIIAVIMLRSKEREANAGRAPDAACCPGPSPHPSVSSAAVAAVQPPSSPAVSATRSPVASS